MKYVITENQEAELYSRRRYNEIIKIISRYNTPKNVCKFDDMEKYVMHFVVKLRKKLESYYMDEKNTLFPFVDLETRKSDMLQSALEHAIRELTRFYLHNRPFCKEETELE